MPRDDDLTFRHENPTIPPWHGNDHLNRLNTALSMSVEAARLKKVIHDTGLDKIGIGGAVMELMGALVVQLKWVAAGAVIAGLIGGIVCSEVPIVGTAGGAALGAQLGAAIVGWCFTGLGLFELTQLAGSVTGAASVPLQEGWNRCSRAGGEREAADLFASAWVMIGMAVIPMICMIVMHKGGGKFLKFSAKYPRLNSVLTALPKAVRNFQSLAIARTTGLTSAEFQALKAMSLDRFILIRAGNPDRLRWVGKLLEGKSLDVKAKTLREGQFRGAVAMDAKDIAKATKNYHIQDLGNGRMKFTGQGELHGFTAETIHYGGEKRFLLRDPDGEFVVGDIDRLAVMEFTQDGQAMGAPSSRMRLKDMAARPDDPNEIAWFNAMLGKLAGKSRANKNAAKHGYSYIFLDEAGKSKYQADSNERLLLFSNGQAFEFSWNEMVEFMGMNQELGLKNVFNAVNAVK